jgi:hypothetical protein
MVTRDCGFAVKVGTLEDSVASLGAALTTLARDRSMRLEMGTSAKRHVAQNYLWRDRHEVIRQWYARVLPASSNIEEGSAVNVCPIGTRQEAVLQPGDGDKSRRLRR